MSLKARSLSTLATFGIYLISWLPLSWTQRLGQKAGHWVSTKSMKTTKITQINIRSCLPELSKEAQQQLIQKNIENTFITGAEMPYIWMRNKACMQALIHNIHGIEAIQQDYAQGKGIIILCPHIGAWEVLISYLPLHFDISSLYRPPKKAYLDAVIKRARQRFGMKMYPTKASGVKALFKALKMGKMVGILPDQDPGTGGGIFAPFFGIETWTMSLVAKLAAKTQAHIYFCYAERLGIGKGFDLHFSYDDNPLYYQKDTLASVTAMNQSIEAIAREHLDQYQWAYKRFKTRPEGEANFYPNT